jgi:hypothetical protein
MDFYNNTATKLQRLNAQGMSTTSFGVATEDEFLNMVAILPF